MLNTEDFIKRLEFIMDHFSLSASSFADKIGVQRSSISHLLSGRNKPSLDFIIKILGVFPELDLYWLLNGTGSFLKINSDEINQKAAAAPSTLPIENDKNESLEISYLEKNAIKENQKITTHTNSFVQNLNDRQLYKIVLFYTDGTIEDFKQKETK